jgi:hypothetical protein
LEGCEQLAKLSIPAAQPTDMTVGVHCQIPLIHENCFPSLAPTKQMIERSIEFHPRDPGHQAQRIRLRLIRKKTNMTPFPRLLVDRFLVDETTAAALRNASMAWQ